VQSSNNSGKAIASHCFLIGRLTGNPGPAGGSSSSSGLLGGAAGGGRATLAHGGGAAAPAARRRIAWRRRRALLPQPTVQARFWLLSLAAVQFSPDCRPAAAQKSSPHSGNFFSRIYGQYSKYRGTSEGWAGGGATLRYALRALRCCCMLAAAARRGAAAAAAAGCCCCCCCHASCSAAAAAPPAARPRPGSRDLPAGLHVGVARAKHCASAARNRQHPHSSVRWI
jgi:hypothetical protein